MAIKKDGTSNKMDVDGELFPQIGTADIKPAVGYVYDVIMMSHHNRGMDHDEDPQRISVIYDRLTLGARGGVLTQYITNTLQGNGQRA
jgi:hypothetical protein